MDSIREILPDAFRRERGFGAEESEQLVCSCWAAAVGPRIAANTQPIRLLGRRLIVDVEGQAWRRELARMSRRIADKVNRSVGSELLEDVDFRVAVPKRRGPGRAESTAGQVPGAAGQVPNDEAVGISDPNLRRLYRRSKKQALEK